MSGSVLLVDGADDAEVVPLLLAEDDDLTIFTHLGLTRLEQVLKHLGGILEGVRVLLCKFELILKQPDLLGVLLGLLLVHLLHDLLACDLVVCSPSLRSDLK